MGLSVNRKALALVDEAIRRSEELRIDVRTGPLGCTIIDAGIRVHGGYAAGRLVTEICLGGCGSAVIALTDFGGLTLPTIHVQTDFPAIATLGSQLAGWNVRTADYYAIGSGPARALSKKPRGIYEQIEYEDQHDSTVIILEADSLPTEQAVRLVATECGVSPRNLYAIVAPTSSVVGTVQVSGRIVEAGICWLWEAGLNPKQLCHSCGYAPIPPIHPVTSKAMAKVNDAIRYGGVAFYNVAYEEDRQLENIVSRGRTTRADVRKQSFYEAFREAGLDFYKIDRSIFSPAVVSVNNVQTGTTFRVGKIDVNGLRQTMDIADA